MRKNLHVFVLFLLFIALSFTTFAQPANDNCGDAIAIGEVSDYAFSTEMATTDGPNHPNDCTSSGTTPDSVYNDVWYLYTPTFTGYAKWSLCATANFDTKIVVYNSGATCPVSDGDLYECNEDFTGCAGSTSEVDFAVTMGESYLLRIGGYGDGSPGEEGTGTFYIVETSPPLPGPDNDDCADAIEVFLGAAQDFDSSNATTDGPEHPTALCFAFGDDYVNADIWYFYTATATTSIEWSTCNIVNWDTRMAVYNAGAVCPLVDSDLLACNDDGSGCTGFTSYMTFSVEEGQTYMLRLGGYLTGDFGTGMFDLNDIVPPEPPSNDNCLESPDSVSIVSPTDADLGEGVNDGTTLNGTQDAGVPACINNGEFNDVWYKFNNEGFTQLEVRFQVNTDQAGFIFEIFEDCGTPALDTANGGVLSNTCFSIPSGEVYVLDSISGFPTVPTDYYVRVSTRITFDPPGDFWFQLVSDEATVSNQEQFLIENAFIFPNPVKGMAMVELDLKESTQTTFEVFDGLGQIMFKEEKGQLLQGHYQFDIGTLNYGSGIYFLKITAGDRQRILKFIKL